MKDILQQIEERQELINKKLTTCLTSNQRHDIVVQKRLLKELTKGEE